MEQSSIAAFAQKLCWAWDVFSGIATDDAVRNLVILVGGIISLVLLFRRTEAMRAQANAAIAAANAAQASSEAAKAQASTAQAQAETARFQAEIAKNNANLTYSSQISDRFIKTTPLLGEKDIKTRIGAVFALGEIANKSPDLHSTVIELLAAYIREWMTIGLAVREGAGAQLNSPQTDISTALEVIGRIHAGNPGSKIHLNLARCDFSSHLITGNFKGAIFSGCNFSNAIFKDVVLAGARFEGAIFDKTSFFRVEGLVENPYYLRDLLETYNDKIQTNGIQFSPTATTQMPVRLQTASSSSTLVNGFVDRT